MISLSLSCVCFERTDISRLSADRERQVRSKLKAAAFTVGDLNWSKLFHVYDCDNSGDLW